MTETIGIGFTKNFSHEAKQPNSVEVFLNLPSETYFSTLVILTQGCLYALYELLKEWKNENQVGNHPLLKDVLRSLTVIYTYIQYSLDMPLLIPCRPSNYQVQAIFKTLKISAKILRELVETDSSCLWINNKYYMLTCENKMDEWLQFYQEKTEGTLS